MTGWDPAAGGQDPPPERPAGGPYGPSAGGSQPPGPSPSAPLRPGPGRPRRSRAKLWLGLGAGIAVVVVVVVVAAVVLLGRGPGAPPGTPNGLQLEELLPKTAALPAGWHVTYLPAESASLIPAGTQPPEPINACFDFNLGFDLGVAGDTFVSAASETARDGAGFLRINLFGVLPGDGAKAISAVQAWAGQCSSYTDGPLTYTVTAAPVPGLGDESLDVHVTQQASGGFGPATDNNTLVVRVGNDLISIECLAPPDLLLSSLASIAAPMAKKLPAASSLAYSAPPPAPSPSPAKPAKPAPPLTPNLTAGQLQRLLPIHSGLPPAFYQTAPQYANDSESPPYLPSQRLTCSKLPLMEGQSFTSIYFNFRNMAYSMASDNNSDEIDVLLDEPGTAALADSDYGGLQELAARCPKYTYQGETYKTVVTSVPGLGNEDIYVKMTPVAGQAAGGLGAQDILLVRVGNDGLVMVDCDMSAGDRAPSLIPIARSLVPKL